MFESGPVLYRYDGGDCYEELSGGVSQARMVSAGGLGGGIGSIIYTRRPAAGASEYPVYNAVGHTVALTDASLKVVQSSLYEAFGDTIQKTGASPNKRLANTRERDATTGLDNHGFRYYNGLAGRYSPAIRWDTAMG